MSEFLVEVYVPRRPQPGTTDPSQAGHADPQPVLGGRDVRMRGSIYLPEDETRLYLVQASSTEAVRAAASRSGLCCERILPAQSDCLDVARRTRDSKCQTPPREKQ